MNAIRALGDQGIAIRLFTRDRGLPVVLTTPDPGLFVPKNGRISRSQPKSRFFNGCLRHQLRLPDLSRQIFISIEIEVVPKQDGRWFGGVIVVCP